MKRVDITQYTHNVIPCQTIENILNSTTKNKSFFKSLNILLLPSQYTHLFFKISQQKKFSQMSMQRVFYESNLRVYEHLS